MCYFVTLGIGEKGRAAVEALGKERAGFSVSSAKNPFVAKLFPGTDTLFYVTHAGCSCDLYSDSRHDETPDKLETHAARYRRKGWSEPKIERALADRRKPRTQPQRADYQSMFTDTVSRLAEQFGSVRLFVHMYEGDVETESISTAGIGVMGVKEFRDGGGKFAADTLVEVAG